MFAAPSARTWDGASGDSKWVTGGAGGNWSNMSVPDATVTAQFNLVPTAGLTTINLSGIASSVKAFSFDNAIASEYTIGAGGVGHDALTLSTGGAITVNPAVIQNATFNANLTLGTDATTSIYTITSGSTTATKTLTLAGTVTGADFAGTRTLAATGAAGTTTVISGVIDEAAHGTVAVTKDGAGTLTLSGANGYAGGTTLSAGTLNINNATALGTGAFTIADSTTLDCTVGGAGITLTSAGAETWNGNFIFTGTSDLNLGTGTVALGGVTRTVTTTANTLTVGGIVSSTGAFGLIKAGAGTLTLTGVNTYGGTTTIDAGTLTVGVASAGSIADSAVTVNNTGTLKGSGTTGAVTINNGGTISPGNSVGTINDTGAVTYNGGGKYVWEINDAIGTAGTSPGWDLQNITGGLTIASAPGNTFAIDITSLAGAVSGAAANFNKLTGYTWTIASASTGIGGFDTTDFTLNYTNTTFKNDISGAVSNGFFGIQVSGNDLQLKYNAAVDAPATAYWTDGEGTQLWNTKSGGNTTNWDTTSTGGIDTGSIPGTVTDVHFYATSAGNFVTTLGQDFTIKSLTMDGGTATSAVSIAAGNTLTINAGGITINIGAGAFTINSGMVLGASQAWLNNSASLFTVAGNVNNGANTLTVDGNGATSISGVISNGALTKTGTGTLTLGGVNTYAGATTVTGGKLLLDHGASGTNDYFVGSGISISSGATFEINQTGIGARYSNVTQTVTGAGTFSKTGTGETDLANDSTGTISTFNQSAGGLINVQAGKFSYFNTAVGNLGSLTIATGATAMLDNTQGANAYFDALNGGGNLYYAAGATARTITLGANGTSGTFSGVISDGVGAAALALTKTGAGTQTLSGANTYTGITTINAGTLGLTGGAAITDAGAVTLANVLNAKLLLNSSETIGSLSGGGNTGGYVELGVNTLTIGGAAITTYSGKMTGTDLTCLLVKTGTGTLTLDGATDNWDTSVSVDGGTLILAKTVKNATAHATVTSGTLQLNGTDDCQIWDGGNVMLNAAGILDMNAKNEIVGSLAGAGTVTNNAVGTSILTSGSALLNNTSTTFSGIIKDGGAGKVIALTKAGTGTLTLSGANTYSGATTITTGKIIAENSRALGTGAGGVTNDATLDIGSTTLNIDGAYTQGAVSTLMVTVNGASSGSIVAAGAAAAIAGYKVALNVSNYVPNNTTYTIINGTGGTGVAAPVITVTGDNRATFTTTTVGEDLILTASRAANGFATDTAAGDSNAAAVGTVLDTITSPSADMSTVLNTMEGLSNSQVASSLDTMVPEVDAGVRDVSTECFYNFVNVVIDRVENVLKLAQNTTPKAATGFSAGDEEKMNNSIWAKGYGSYLNQDLRKGIQGYDAWNAGTALGADHTFTDIIAVADTLTVGISGGYAYGNVDSDANNGNTCINSGQTTAYGGYQFNEIPLFIDAAGTFAWNWYNGSRDIVVGTIRRTANAAYDGQQYGAYIGTGYRINMGRNLFFTPLASLNYMHLHLAGYTETEAGALSLSAASQDYDILQSGLGARVEYPLTVNWGTVTPEVHGKWLYDFIGDNVQMTSTFTGGGGAFGTNGCPPAQNSFDVGGKLSLALKNDISVIGECDTELKEDFWGIYGAVTVRYNF